MRASLLALSFAVAAELIAADSPASKPANVLLITVDTLRADHLSCYGYGLKTSPYIDKLAQEGTRFDRAYTVIPLTGPAHLSLFSSRYPQEHGARRNGLAMASDRTLVTLPQILRGNGYLNSAFVSAWPLTSRLSGMDSWFDHYEENLTRTYQMFNSSRWAEDVTPEAITWLKQNGGNSKPFFMWVHYFDPHSPYDFREHFADLKQNGSDQPAPIADQSMSERVRNYDTEIAYTDWYIGKLLSALDEMKLSDSTLVVLTADHGESLGEHEYVGHGRHLYENIIRVPLIMRLPGKVKAGQVVPTPVSIVDITPTILDLTVPGAVRDKKIPVRFVGRTLAPALTNGAKLSERRIYTVTFPGKKGFAPKWLSWMWVRDEELPLRFGYVEGNSKVVWAPEDQRAVAFDISGDPLEIRPKTLSSETQAYRNQTERLKTWFARTESRASEEKLTARDLEVLKSLGYVQ